MLKIILTIVFVLICIALTVIVLLQEGKSQGLGAIGGMAESFVAKSKVKNFDSKLQKATIIVGIVFVIATIALNVLSLSA